MEKKLPTVAADDLLQVVGGRLAGLVDEAQHDVRGLCELNHV